MAPRDLSKFDASAHAAAELEYLLRQRNKSGEVEKRLTPEEAMSQKRVYSVKSDRDITRVLFVSQNTDLLNPTTQTLDGYVNISDLFDEVHVLILRQGIVPQRPVLRVASNVWMYTAAAKYWWQLPKRGYDMAANQLKFANGFRPDLIVARDPFESALVVHWLAAQFSRPTQLHVMHELTSPKSFSHIRSRWLRLRIAQYTIPKFQSVRTVTGKLQTYIEQKHPIPDISVLPRFQDYEALIEQNETVDLKTQYKPHSIFLLFIGKLTAESSLFRVLNAAVRVLRNERIALLVLGDGPARSQFERHAKHLGIDRSVIFKAPTDDIQPFLNSAHVLIVSDTDRDSEEVVLRGAAAGIPMLVARTEERANVFTHNQSLLFFTPDDTQALTVHIDTLLNDIPLRTKLGSVSQEIIHTHFHTDPTAYREAYRESVEQAFFVDISPGE